MMVGAQPLAEHGTLSECPPFGMQVTKELVQLHQSGYDFNQPLQAGQLQVGQAFVGETQQQSGSVKHAARQAILQSLMRPSRLSFQNMPQSALQSATCSEAHC